MRECRNEEYDGQEEREQASKADDKKDDRCGMKNVTANAAFDLSASDFSICTCTRLWSFSP